MNKNSDIQNTSGSESYLDQSEKEMYLIFRLGEELYGTPLLGVRQVMESQRAKSVPNTIKHFLGLASIRGQIIGVVDLRIRFNYPANESTDQAFLVFDTETGPIAAIVDRVEAVMRVQQSMETEVKSSRPNIKIQIPLEFLLGATTYQSNLVTLIDLNKTLSQEDYVEIQKAKLALVG